MKWIGVLIVLIITSSGCRKWESNYCGAGIYFPYPVVSVQITSTKGDFYDNCESVATLYPKKLPVQRRLSLNFYSYDNDFLMPLTYDSDSIVAAYKHKWGIDTIAYFIYV